MARKLKKLNKKFTIMVVPHSNTAIRSLKLPLWLINGLAIIGLISLLVVTYLAFSYVNWQITKVENEELKIVNKNQAQEIKILQETTADTLQKLENIIETESKIRELVGLEQPEKERQSSRAQGGPSSKGRTLITFSLNNFDFLNNIKEQAQETTVKLEQRYQLPIGTDETGIAKIKNDLGLINKIILEQEEVLEKLEVDVKNRLEFLEAIPSGWPIKGRITSNFGWRRNPFNKKTWEFHEGLDIAGSYGASVKAAGAGKVIFAGWKPAYGRTVVIRHGFGYVSQYAHNSSTTVKVGQDVKRGQVIARVGSTGRSTGPHVDFRITYNGRFIDPKKILK